MENTKRIADEEGLKTLRTFVATRLVDWRSDVLETAAHQANAELQGNYLLGQSIEGMAAFKAMLERLVWIIHEREFSLGSPAAAMGRLQWLLDDVAVVGALESGARATRS